MKKFFMMLTAIFFIALFFTACSSDDSGPKSSAVAVVARQYDGIRIVLEDGTDVTTRNEWAEEIELYDTIEYIRIDGGIQVIRLAKEQPQEICTTITKLKPTSKKFEISFSNGQKFSVPRGTNYEKDLSVGDTLSFTYYKGEAEIHAVSKKI